MLRALPAAAGTLALPLALAAALGGLVVRASAGPPPEGRVELEVAGVLPLPEGQSCILVLRERGRSTLLPLVLARQDPEELRDQLRGHAPQGLAVEALLRLGAKVQEVELASADDSRDGARVRLAQGGRHVDVRARPGESVLLAVAAGAPIVTTRRLLLESGLEPEDLHKAKQKLDGPEREPVKL
ncbi:MAG: DUF151 domain-containing protein [Anaeromyxobacter sp.]